jgi:hypothetical protein
MEKTLGKPVRKLKKAHMNSHTVEMPKKNGLVTDLTNPFN